MVTHPSVPPCQSDGVDRAVSPVLASALLVGLTVALAAAVGATGLAVEPAEPAPVAALDLSVEVPTGGPATLRFAHGGGDTLDVRELRLTVAVDGEPLAHPPPVPFFAATGFRSGPTGPFNAASDPRWTAGETASLGLAGTNAPPVEPGSTVAVTVYARGHRLLTLRAVAVSAG